MAAATAAAPAPAATAAGAVPFPLLAGTYAPATFDYYADCSRDPAQPVTFASWIEVFRHAISTFKTHAASSSSQEVAERFAADFSAALDALLAAPHDEPPGFSSVQPVSCITLCALREEVLRRHGLGDIFKAVKETEDAAALQLLPGVLAQLDAQPSGRAALEMALRGVFAGNIFDLGAAASAQRYEAGQGAGFHCALDQLLPRPWVIDDLDAVLAALEGHVYSKALLFVDNAGADVLLGMLPFARELLKRGTQVVLAANAGPTINDITAAELAPLVRAAAQHDAPLARALEAGRLRVLSSGNDLPVIDLRSVSPELAAEAAGADLVVLEGMGRAIETNLTASFTVDCLKLGMIKHPEVAACLGGRLYDCVCRLSRAGSDASVQPLGSPALN